MFDVEVSLSYHGRKARLPLRAMASSPKKNSGLVNQRWRTYIDFLKEIFDGQKIFESCFDRWDMKLDKMAEDWRSIDQHITSLEQDAWQPRLAMKADGPANTKTRESTKGVATAVQAMHGESCSATRVELGPKINSTSFGVMIEPPDLSCREDVLVENGDASPNCVSQPWRCAHHQPPVAYFPPAKPL